MAKDEHPYDIIRRTGHSKKTTRRLKRATGKQRFGCFTWCIATAAIATEIVRRVR